MTHCGGVSLTSFFPESRCFPFMCWDTFTSSHESIRLLHFAQKFNLTEEQSSREAVCLWCCHIRISSEPPEFSQLDQNVVNRKAAAEWRCCLTFICVLYVMFQHCKEFLWTLFWLFRFKHRCSVWFHRPLSEETNNWLCLWSKITWRQLNWAAQVTWLGEEKEEFSVSKKYLNMWSVVVSH